MKDTESMDNVTLELFDLDKTIMKDYIMEYSYTWLILNELPSLITKLGSSLDNNRFNQIEKDIWVAKSAKIAKSVSINPPCIIDENAEIRQSAFIRGSAVIGKNSVIGNSVEIKNSIIFDYAEIPHFNYVGDSIIGYKAHLAGGVITSNIKIDKTPISIIFKDKVFDSGRIKVGALVADYAEIGCNSVLNPGTIISRGSRVYPLTSIRGFIPPNTIVKDSNTLVPIS